MCIPMFTVVCGTACVQLLPCFVGEAGVSPDFYKVKHPDSGKQSDSVPLYHVNISTQKYTVALEPQEEMFVQITKQFNGMYIPRGHNSGRKKKKINKFLKGTCLG